MAYGYPTPWRRGSVGGGFGSSLLDLNRQMNRLFDDLFEPGALQRGEAWSGGTSWPQLEIEQNDDRIEITAELPGVNQDDIELDIEDGMLRLSGEKRSARKDENGYSERSYGRFERRLTLPGNVDEERCSAEFRDGLLTITLPRAAEKSRGRRIPLGGQRAAGTIDAQNDREERPLQQVAEESAGAQRDESQQG